MQERQKTNLYASDEIPYCNEAIAPTKSSQHDKSQLHYPPAKASSTTDGTSELHWNQGRDPHFHHDGNVDKTKRPKWTHALKLWIDDGGSKNAARRFHCDSPGQEIIKFWYVWAALVPAATSRLELNEKFKRSALSYAGHQPRRSTQMSN